MDTKIIWTSAEGIFESWSDMNDFKELIQRHAYRNTLPHTLYLQIHNDISLSPQIYELSHPVNNKIIKSTDSICKMYLLNRDNLVQKRRHEMSTTIREKYYIASSSFDDFLDELIKSNMIEKKVIIPEFKTLNNYFEANHPIESQGKKDLDIGSELSVFTSSNFFYVIKIKNVIYKIRNRGKLTTSKYNLSCISELRG